MTHRTAADSHGSTPGPGRPPRLPDWMLALLAVSILLIIALGMIYRSSSDEPPQTAVRTAEPQLPVSEAFSDLRPAPEDKLVIPALGFRWRFRPDSVSVPATPEPAAEEDNTLQDIEFVVFLADSSGQVLLEELADRPDGVRLLLPPEIGPGDYLWWVEAVPAQGPRLRSHQQPIRLGR